MAGLLAGCHSPSLNGSDLAKSDARSKPSEARFAWARIRGVPKSADAPADARIVSVKSGQNAATVATGSTPNEKGPVTQRAKPKTDNIKLASFDTPDAKGKLTAQPPAALKPTPVAAPQPALAPAPAGVVAASPPTEVVVESAPVGKRRPVALLRPYGATADQPGLADNISARVGMTYFDVAKDNAVGASFMLESSFQLGQKDWFLHGGIGAEYLDSEWPVATTLGFSKLATVEGDQVTKHGVFSVAYDSYFDTSYFGTNDNIYIDQIRVLAGWAFTPRLDAGMWAAFGLQGDGGTIATPAGPGFIPARFGDRVAGYVSTNVGNSGSLLIASAGWEEGPGRFFAEADMFAPLTDSLNLFGGFGFTDAKSFDAIVGLEFIPGNWKGKHKHCKGDICEPADPCGDVCVASACDPCAPTYRGGWANDNYRGALRLISPSRMRRMIEDPNLHMLAAAAAAPRPAPVVPPPVILAPDVPATQDPPPKVDPPTGNVGGSEPPQLPPPQLPPPVVCPPAPATPDLCVPRILTRPKRVSTLSQTIAAGGQL